MADSGKAQGGKFWYRGQVTRRRLVGWSAASAGALGAAMLVPAPWRAAFGAERPYKIGSFQSLSGAAAAGGKTALVGLQMAVDRINTSGGINGRPLELLVVDDESKPDVGRRKTEKLAVEDQVDAHVGGAERNAGGADHLAAGLFYLCRIGIAGGLAPGIVGKSNVPLLT